MQRTFSETLINYEGNTNLDSDIRYIHEECTECKFYPSPQSHSVLLISPSLLLISPSVADRQSYLSVLSPTLINQMQECVHVMLGDKPTGTSTDITFTVWFTLIRFVFTLDDKVLFVSILSALAGIDR